MSGKADDFSDWRSPEAPGVEGDVLIVDIEGFEGPLDLLLALSRTRKIDLKAISIAELAGQYISYIENLKRHRLEIAADYLVMAAWLTYLKSKLLLPGEDDHGETPSADELALKLAFRLRRLDAMRRASEVLMDRAQLQDAFFPAGAPQGMNVIRQLQFKADQFELLSAYAATRQNREASRYQVKKRQVWSIKKARARLESLLGFPIGWAPINDLIATFLEGETVSKTSVASTFGASLELAREGEVVLRQDGHFTPLYIRVCEKNAEKVDDEAKEARRNEP